MNNKIILYLRSEFTDQPHLPAAGGSVSHTIGVIKGFQQIGHQIVCVASCMIPALEQLRLNQLNTLYIPRLLRKIPWHLNCVLSNIFYTMQTLLYMRGTSINYIYQRYNYTNLTGLILRRIKRVPFILEYNGSDVWALHNWINTKNPTLGQRVFYAFARKSEQWNLAGADYIVVVSQALKDELTKRGIYAHKILVNPNGVDTDLFDPVALFNDRQQIRNQLGIDNKFVFGFVGTFSYWHGIETIAGMIPSIILKKPQAHFLFIGDGPLLEWLKHEVAEYSHAVTFTGLLPSEQTKHYLAACDAFLSPTQPNSDGSRFFGSPTKIFEYLSMGKPTIASALEQLNELIVPGTGILVPPQNTQDFVQAATLLIDLPAVEREKMGIRARERACQLYTWKQHVAHIKTFIEKDTRGS